MQEWYCPSWGMGYSLIYLRSPDPTIRKINNWEKL
jgi:hypothetical protein